MKQTWIMAAGLAIVSLSLVGRTATAQPILERVESLLREQLGGARPAAPAAEPGYLGLIGDDTPDQNGVQLLDVYAGQPADQAGLAVGDVITAVDGRKVRTMQDLLAALDGKPPGTKLKFTVSRNSESLKRDVTLGRRPTTGELPPPPQANSPFGKRPADSDAARPKLGVRTVPVTPDVQRQHNLPNPSGGHVISVGTDSPAERAGIPLGAVITAVNDRPIGTPQELAAAIQSATDAEVEITFVHAGRTQRVNVELEMPRPAVKSDSLVDTQARPAQPPALVPADGPTTSANERIEELERRVEELEAKIKALESGQ